MPAIRSLVSSLIYAGLLLGVVFCHATVIHAAHFKILMIGNSYTQGNETARATGLDLQGLFDGDPEHSGSVTMRAEGSASLQNHAGNSDTTSLITNPANIWDVIILQERSTRPGLAMKYGGSELSGLNNGGPVLINNFIKPYQPQASVVLFNTWARELDNEDLIDDFNNNPTEMLTYTNQGYDRIRKNLPAWNHSDVTTIARVGDAWEDWYQTYGYAGSNGLHSADGTHQNDRGAYLAAAVLFETITNKKSIGNSYLGAVTGSISGISTVQLLQEQASAITGVVPDSADFDGDGDVDGRDFQAWQRGFGITGTAQPSDGDANNNGSVDAEDLAIWQAQYGSPLSLSTLTASEVPEPSLLAYLILAILLNVYRPTVRPMQRYFCVQIH